MADIKGKKSLAYTLFKLQKSVCATLLIHTDIAVRTLVNVTILKLFTGNVFLEAPKCSNSKMFCVLEIITEMRHFKF